ncbi:MAG: hypothetical protein ACXQTD_03450 [Candidatus Syntropharchaeia archaeon]
MQGIDRRKVYEQEWERRLKEILKDGPKTQKELVEILGCSSVTLYNWLRFFEAKGVISVKYNGKNKVVELVKK